MNKRHKKNKDNTIPPINAKLDNVANTALRISKKGIQDKSKLHALYSGKLPIGTLELDCAVLSDETRILSKASIFNAFDRPSRGNRQIDTFEYEGEVITLPPFMASKTLYCLFTKDLLDLITPIEYLDGSNIKTGYKAEILSEMCKLYLAARRKKMLAPNQIKLAEQSEILLSSFANVGIAALIDEATGFQVNRKHDALRILLERYIATEMQKWLRMFPDSFFMELDRLYGNAKTTSRKRPQYYGLFINKYIYDPIEHGYVKAELDKLNITDEGKRKARFHQWLNEEGRRILTLQIGRVQGLMEACDDIVHFKKTMQKKKEISIAPYLFNEMNKLIE